MYQLVETVVTKYLNVESIDVHSVVTEALVKHVDKLVVSCNDYFFNSCHIMSNGVVLYCSLFITLITLSSVHCFWQNFLSLFLSLSLSFFFPMNNVLPTHPHSTGCFYNFLFITSLEQFDYFVPLCSFLHICCPKFSINSLDGWVYNFHCLEIF